MLPNQIIEEDCENQPLLLHKKKKLLPIDFKNFNVKKLFNLFCYKKQHKKKLLDEYYKHQNNLLNYYTNDSKTCQNQYDCKVYNEENDAKSSQLRKTDKLLASVIFVWNLIMLCGNLTASILSGSYSVISAFIDSSMDIISSVIVFSTIWAINNTNMFNYPRGRQRLEIVSVIICSIFMGVTNIMMIIQSIEAIINDTVKPDANFPTLIILTVNISIKIIFMIFCYKHSTSNSLILALDQRNDIITSLVAMAGAVIGDHYWKYADPIGAILVCTFIAVSWFCNAFENIPLIVGRRAEQEHISRILRIAIDHDDRIICLDHIMVYHIGEKALVEVHIVLDENLPLKITHDITEALEKKIKLLDFVERVFVHVDYRCDGHEDGI